MLKCKFGGDLHSKLAKAHVIPRSFYKVVRGSDKYSAEIQVKENYEKEKQWQSGIHDSEIVCRGCEKKFNSYDTYGYQTLTKTLDQKKQVTLSNGSPYAYEIENYDYHKLKLFFLSMLWRAHASSLTFFSNISLGPHESIMRSYISEGKAPAPHEYDIVLFHQQHQPTGIIPPWKFKADGVNIYRFYLPNIVALIKIDRRPIPEIFRSLTLKINSPARLIFLPYSDSSEEKYLEEINKIYQMNNSKS